MHNSHGTWHIRSPAAQTCRQDMQLDTSPVLGPVHRRTFRTLSDRSWCTLPKSCSNRRGKLSGMRCTHIATRRWSRTSFLGTPQHMHRLRGRVSRRLGRSSSTVNLQGLSTSGIPNGNSDTNQCYCWRIFQGGCMQAHTRIHPERARRRHTMCIGHRASTWHSFAQEQLSSRACSWRRQSTHHGDMHTHPRWRSSNCTHRLRCGCHHRRLHRLRTHHRHTSLHTCLHSCRSHRLCT